MPVEKTALRRFAIAASGLAVLLALGGGWIAANAPVDDVDDRFATAVTQATGLTVRTGGEGSVSFFPSPRVRIPGVRLSQGDEPPFAVAPELVGAVSVFSLLAGRIELAEITLTRPEIALDHAPLAAALGRLRDASGRGSAPAIRIENGRVRFAGREIDRVDAGLVWPRDGGPLALSGFGRYEGRKVEATFQLADLAAFARSESAPFRARIQSEGARLLFDGTASSKDGLGLVGSISARASTLGDTLAWLGLPASGRRTPGKNGEPWSLSFAGRGTLDKNGLSVSNGEFDLSGDSFLGAGSVTAAADGKPIIEATLDADDLDLKPYVAVLAPEILRADGSWSDAPVDLSALGGVRLDLRLSADRLKLGRLEIGQTAATVAVAKGGLDLAIGEASAYGGTIGGRLSLEQRGDGAHMRLEGAATAVALDDALEAMLERAPMSGAFSGEVAVESAGASIADLVAGLTGRASAKLVDGAFEDIGRSRTLTLAGLGRRMNVTEADGAARIHKGFARIDDVVIKGTEASFALAGSASLIHRDVKLKGVVRTAADNGWTLPVTLEGPLSAPRLRADLGARPPQGEARRGAPSATR